MNGISNFKFDSFVPIIYFMCGIHGFIDSQIDSEVAERLIDKMINSSNHRGPDHSAKLKVNNCFLGHNRLSILDLSELGNQPMTFGKFTIVFNGEIYNYQEIRSELIQNGVSFQSDSDTEVIIKGYALLGDKIVDRFLGMWAFAIYNSEERTLFCSRDRFGIKPFYYIHQEGKNFYFASEIKPLKFSPSYSNNVNINQVVRGLQLGWMVYKNETYFEKIVSLEPGCNLFFDANGKLEIKRYWKIKKNEFKNNSIEKFQEVFFDSLRLHLRSDVPIGATLSGGIDSSSIVSSIISQGLSNDLHTFSIYYEGKNAVDERPFIQEVEKKYKGHFTSNHYSPSLSEIDENFHEISRMVEFPLSGSSCISHYSLMNIVANQGIKVIISGQGADDYMAGYLHSFYRLFADQIRQLRFKQFIREFKQYQELQQNDFRKNLSVLAKSMMSVFLNEERLYNIELKNYYPFLGRDLKNRSFIFLDDINSTKMDDFHYTLMNYSSLPTILHYEDRISMAKSIETRVPFLDHRLVELFFDGVNENKIKNGYTKRLLRDSMSNILPEAIQWRTDKKGFVTPGEVLWLRGNLSHLLEIDYQRLDFLDKNKTKKVIDEFKNGDNSKANLVWRVASLNYWMKHFV